MLVKVFNFNKIVKTNVQYIISALNELIQNDDTRNIKIQDELFSVTI